MYLVRLTVKLEQRVACSAANTGIGYDNVARFVWRVFLCSFKELDLVVPFEDITFDELCIPAEEKISPSIETEVAALTSLVPSQALLHALRWCLQWSQMLYYCAKYLSRV